ncbi:unnamed protein product [Allacma fusca]|uniref:Uncharacterized protein n=1 Tax=Allacma fusca TaxID=39272 RepID=A0A8J2KT99_9HEXA|nr:unnamed protein product [Allacma fusca]
MADINNNELMEEIEALLDIGSPISYSIPGPINDTVNLNETSEGLIHQQIFTQLRGNSAVNIYRRIQYFGSDNNKIFVVREMRSRRMYRVKHYVYDV